MSKAIEKLSLAAHVLLGHLPRRLRLWLMHRWIRRRSLTLGVRALVLDEQGRVLLVRHTYQPGWTLPGGGVERGETVGQTLAHELLDEVGLHLLRQPELFGVYANHAKFPNDHVLLFVLRPGQYERLEWRPNAEIADMDFFHPSELPADTTPGARRRIAEVLHAHPPSAHW